MKIVSMVPSWTETLLEAGLDVVGRTRFCIHPVDRAPGIPVVGGTKNADWEKIRALQPDLLILDREENPKDFAENSPCPWIATHVSDLQSLNREFRNLGKILNAPMLNSLADRGERVFEKGPRLPGSLGSTLLESWGDWRAGQDPVIYVIWKNPWMAVGPETYIDSVLEWAGIPRVSLPEGKYPEIPEELLRNSVGLFSSEPYPFVKKSTEAKQICSRGALVNGESFSWFGIRGLRFLESLTDS